MAVPDAGEAFEIGLPRVVLDTCFSHVHHEDVVRKKKPKKGRKSIGIVVRTARDESDSDDSDEDNDDESLQEGQVMIGWHSLLSKWNEDEIEIINENELELVDRSLLPGDVVRWISTSKGMQKGHIKEVKVIVDICIAGTNHILRHVDSKLLLPLLEFPQASLVAMGPWLGVVRDRTLKAVLSIKNGSKCEVVGNLPDLLNDATDQRESDSTFYCADFYEGQQVVGSARVFKEARWIAGSRPVISNHSSVKAVVNEVAVESIEVAWHVCGFAEEPSLKDPPPILLAADVLREPEKHRLRELQQFQHACIQIGDKAFYVITEEDAVKFKRSPVFEDTRQSLDGNERRVGTDAADTQLKQSENSTMAPMPPLCEETSVHQLNSLQGSGVADLRLMDAGGAACTDLEACSGKAEPDSGLAARQNEPLRSASAQAPRSRGQRARPRRHHPKCRKRYKVPVCLRPGEKVCVEVCETRTAVSVVWQDGSESYEVNSVDLYPVLHLDELEFFPGDFVIDKRVDKESSVKDVFGIIQRVDHESRLCDVRWTTVGEMLRGEAGTIESGLSVYDITDHPDFVFRPGDAAIRLSAGTVRVEEKPRLHPVGLILSVSTTGHVKVCWANGEVSDEVPSELFFLDIEQLHDDTQPFFDDGDDDEVDADNDSEWETASDQEYADESGLGSILDSSERQLDERSFILDDIITRSLSSAQSSAQQRNLPSVTNESELESMTIQDAVDSMSRLSTEVRGVITNAQQLLLLKADSESVASAQHALKDIVTKLDEALVVNDQQIEEASRATPSSAVKVDLLTSMMSQVNRVMADCTKFMSAVDGDVPVSDSSSTGALVGEIGTERTVGVAVRKSVFADESALEKEAAARGKGEHQELSHIVAVEGTTSKQGRESPSIGLVQEVLPCADESAKPGSSLVNCHARETVPSARTRSLSLSERSFVSVELAPVNHKYHDCTDFRPPNMRLFTSALAKDLRLLQSDLPGGILVRTFENRMDLLSVLIIGPQDTPYEGGVFLFDMQLSEHHPTHPPSVHYHAYCSGRLNPNLYEEGKVCVSLLGTWSGKGSETWTSKSTLKQLLVSLQALILVEEPYYNEAGYEKQRGTAEGLENSRLYNEMAILRVLQSVSNLLRRPPELFRDEIFAFFKANLPCLVRKIRSWLALQKLGCGPFEECQAPRFPLLPLSKAFCTSAERTLTALDEAMKNISQ